MITGGSGKIDVKKKEPKKKSTQGIQFLHNQSYRIAIASLPIVALLLMDKPECAKFCFII